MKKERIGHSTPWLKPDKAVSSIRDILLKIPQNIPVRQITNTQIKKMIQEKWLITHNPRAAVWDDNRPA